MTTEEYKWNVTMVQERNFELNLSFDQAESIYKHEQNKDIHSSKYFLSTWEELDWDLTVFKNILSTSQFNAFEKRIHTNIERLQQELIENNEQSISRVKMNKEILDYYKAVFIPDFLKLSFLTNLISFKIEKNKIEYLKAEYKAYLNDQKKKLVGEHFRHFRTFLPNILEANLLEHDISYLWPKYKSFELEMDIPSKTIANYLKTKQHFLNNKTTKFINDKLTQLHNFKEEIFEKYNGNNEGSGWHTVTINASQDDITTTRFMTIILFDTNQYVG